jgi:hypothetical protein
MHQISDLLASKNEKGLGAEFKVREVRVFTMDVRSTGVGRTHGVDIGPIPCRSTAQMLMQVPYVRILAKNAVRSKCGGGRQHLASLH